MKKLVLMSLAAVLALSPLAFAADHTDTWKGEIVDLACYVAQGAKGPDHASCAKACVKNGQPMGLLTDDGTLVLLAQNHKDPAPYEALKDLAGDMAEVTGELAEKDGMKLVTVTASKAAS